MKKPAKEKKQYGIMEFTEHSERWIKIAIAAVIVIVLTTMGSRAYNTYTATECDKTECAENVQEEKELVAKELGENAIETGKKVNVDGTLYEIYEIKGKEKEYALLNWELIEGEGRKIGAVEKGLEEKEMIPTQKEGQYIAIWGADEERVIVMENEVEKNRYKKQKSEIRVLEIETETPEKIEFKK